MAYKYEFPARCPRCGSTKVVKNGYTRHGRQNLKCKDCSRQFGFGDREARRVPEAVRRIVERMLNCGFTVRDINDITGVSKGWIYARKTGP